MLLPLPVLGISNEAMSDDAGEVGWRQLTMPLPW
jgi:hypothetical protein